MSVYSISSSDFVRNVNSPFRMAMDALLRSRQSSPTAPSVVILGAGPAGLIRGIQSLLNGSQTTIVEKRAENCSKRENTVRLDDRAIALLKEYGVVQYLEEKQMIFAPKDGFVNIRLKDLEDAMKAVIHELSPRNPVIQYESEADEILRNTGDPISVILKKSSGERTQINRVDLLVVAEGARSPTNERLLGNRRIEVLPPVPVITAVFKDDRPNVRGVSTFFSYAGKTLYRTCLSVYYHTLFFFKFVFQGENFWNANRKIGGAIILKTPGQDYMGSGLSREESQKLLGHLQKVNEAKAALSTAQRENQIHAIASLKKKLEDVQKSYDAYLNYWTRLSCCFSNIFNVLSFFYTRGDHSLQLTHFLPPSHIHVTEIGADRAERFSGRIGSSRYLVVGDSAATVDPTTGLGCNTAITTSASFREVLRGMQQVRDDPELLINYDRNMDSAVQFMHSQAVQMRRLYRPDAISPRMLQT